MNPQASATQLQQQGSLVGGKFLTGGERLEVRSPWEDALVSVVYRPSDAQVEEAVRLAQQAFEETSALPTYRRVEVLQNMAGGLEKRRDALVRILALEAGKPVKAGRVEVERAIFNFRNAAAETQRIAHEFLPLDLTPANKGRTAIVRRVPIGPVLAITPFNFPLNLVVHKIAPALAAGNPIVVKPSPKTPLSALALGEIALEAGAPTSAVQVLAATDEQTARLVADERFAMLTFTGSAAVGWRLKSLAGKKRVALELGGNAGAIVHSDANLEFAAERCTVGGFSYAGQSCISVQRILVHRPVYEQFVPLLVGRVKALVLGSPLDEKTDVGPLIRPSEAQRMEEWVAEAVAGGGRVLVGGKRRGSIFEPTVLTATRPEMRVNCQEVFGPVVTVEPYDTFDEAIARVNDSPYGLQTGVFTSDLKLTFRAFERLRVGAVMANDMPSFRADQMPYGGTKDSGLGREGVRYAIEEMTDRKVLVLNLDA
jgi:acyl-CoA reductase-like NAD-dependent aldehyde dehydrogenase